jgi:hypothetical protein
MEKKIEEEEDEEEICLILLTEENKLETELSFPLRKINRNQIGKLDNFTNNICFICADNLMNCVYNTIVCTINTKFAFACIVTFKHHFDILRINTIYFAFSCTVTFKQTL